MRVHLSTWGVRACAWLVLLAAAGGVAAQQSGIVYVQKMEKRIREDGGRTLQQTFEMLNERVEYALCYDSCVTPQTPPGRCFSKLWVYKIGFATFGMTVPAQNWYGQGFFNVLLDGEGIQDYQADTRILRMSGSDGIVEAHWPAAKADVFVRFMLREGDDKLLMEVELKPKTELKQIQLNLLCYPCFFYGDKDRWISTAVRDVQHENEVRLDPAKEYWVLYYDKLSGDKRTKRSVGPCAMMYLPEEAKSVRVTVGAYPIYTYIEYPPETRKFHLALWDFAKWKSNEENLKYLKKNGAAFLKDVRERCGDWLGESRRVVLPEPREGEFRKVEKAKSKPTPYEEMTGEVVTPHVKWAKPYAGGKTRVLVLAPRWRQRETVELAQRFDIEYDTVSFSKSGVIYEERELNIYNTYAKAYGLPLRSVGWVLKDLRGKLERGGYDCMIIAGVETRVLPEYFRELILKRVEEGMGLVVTGSNEALEDALGEVLPPGQGFKPVGIPFDQLPLARDYAVEGGEKPVLYRCRRRGKGRAVFFSYPVQMYTACITPAPSSGQWRDFTPVHEEYCFAMFGKAMLWAAGKTAGLKIESVDPKTCKAVLAADGAAGRVSLRVLARDGEGFVEGEAVRDVDVGAGRGEYSFDLPRMGRGPRFVDVFVAKDGKTLDWFTAFMTKESDVGIEELAAEGKQAEGEAYEVAVRWKLKAPAGARLRVELRDNLDRVLGVEERSAGDGAECRATFVVPRPVTMLHYVTAVLANSGGLLDRRREAVVIPDSNRENFSFIAWSSGDVACVRRGINRQIYKYGVDAIDNTGMTGADEAGANMRGWYAAKANLRSIPYITRIASWQKQGLVRKPCLTNPGYLNEWMEGLRERTRGIMKYGCLGYTLGDENYLVAPAVDVCFSPTCVADFRKWLQARYDTLGALNEEWGTNFKNWEKVTPITLEDARKKGDFARWCDHRMHMEDVFTRAHALGVKAIREVDKKARVGFDGVFSTDSFHGYDFSKLVPACRVLQVYQQSLMQVEYLRSFARPGSLIGGWCNGIGNDNEVSARRVPWHLLLHGGNSVWYWTTFNCGEALLYPDLRPAPLFLWMAEECNEIKAGVGALLMHAQRLDDRIAVHYSQASIHGNTILWRRLRDSHRGFAQVLEDLGLQYNFVSYEQIENDELRRAGYKLFVMPASVAVSTKEAEAIRAFVKGGGVVVADAWAGLMDGHCKPLKAGCLDDVFGVSQTPLDPKRLKGKPATAQEEVEPIKVNAKLGGVELPVGAVDKKLEARSAESLGEGAGGAPAVCVNAFGKGKAIFLNFDSAKYTALRKTVEEEPVRTMMEKLLSDCGVRSRIRIAEKRKALNACETVFFRDGECEYCAVVKDDNIEDEAKRTAEIVFPQRRHIYDVRAKRYLGERQRIMTDITPGVPKVYALLPYKVESVSAHLATEGVKPGGAVRFTGEIKTSPGPPAGTHVIHAEVLDPNGKVVRCYSQNLLTKTGKVEGVVYLALSDPRGGWRLRLTDAASGRSCEAGFTVAK